MASIKNNITVLNPELSLVVDDDWVPEKVNKVIKYFEKVGQRIIEKEIVTFSSFNEFFPRKDVVDWSLITSFKPFSGYFSYVLPLDWQLKPTTLRQNFDFLKVVPVRFVNCHQTHLEDESYKIDDRSD